MTDAVTRQDRTSRQQGPVEKTLRMALVVTMYLFSSGILMYCFVTRGGLNSLNFQDNSFMSFSKMINWTASWPYVYRTLLPTSVRIIAEITPAGFKARVNAYVLEKPYFKKIAWTTRYSYECLVALSAIFCLWVTQGFLWRYLIGVFFDYEQFVADIAPVAGLLGLTALFLSNWTAIYDPVTVFMGTLGLALVVSRRHLLYYIFFPLAVLNKVTAYLNTGVFLAHEFGSMPNRRLFLHVLAQGLIWLGIMAALVYAFRDNPGNRADFMLFWNFRTFISAVSVYHSVYSILFFLLAAFLIGYRWRARPPMLRRMFVVTAVLFVPAVLLFGRASDELRVWYDLYPLVFLLSVGTVCDLLEVGMTVPSQMHSAEGKRE